MSHVQPNKHIPIPYEVLSAIFSMTYMSSPTIKSLTQFAVATTHVSRQWRSVAISTKILWTTLTGDMPIDQLHIFFHRSNNELLTLVAGRDIDPHLNGSRHRIRLECVFGFLIQYPTRFSTVLSTDKFSSDIIFNLFQSKADEIRACFSSLQYIFLRSDGFVLESDKSAIAGPPRPKRNESTHLHDTNVSVCLTLPMRPANNLQYLSISIDNEYGDDQTPWDPLHLITALTCFPLLITLDLHFWSITFPQLDDDSLPRIIIPIKNLMILCGSGDDTFLLDLFGQIQTPLLEYLQADLFYYQSTLFLHHFTDAFCPLLDRVSISMVDSHVTQSPIQFNPHVAMTHIAFVALDHISTLTILGGNFGTNNDIDLIDDMIEFYEEFNWTNLQRINLLNCDFDLETIRIPIEKLASAHIEGGNIHDKTFRSLRILTFKKPLPKYDVAVFLRNKLGNRVHFHSESSLESN